MSPEHAATAGKAVVWSIIILSGFALYLWGAVQVGTWLHRKDVERQFQALLDQEAEARLARLATKLWLADQIAEDEPFHMDEPTQPRLV